MRVAACGTDSGYYRHLRGTKTQPKTVPCDPCLAAHSEANKKVCTDCGGEAWGKRCRPCGDLWRVGRPQKRRKPRKRPQPVIRTVDESPAIIEHWVRDGLIWRAAPHTNFAVRLGARRYPRNNFQDERKAS